MIMKHHHHADVGLGTTAGGSSPRDTIDSRAGRALTWLWPGRYEDPVSDPEGLLAVGVVIQAFGVQSTDGQWKPTFVSREEVKKKVCMHHQVMIL
jgi:hypothetical protein